jgi:hypothetical protein
MKKIAIGMLAGLLLASGCANTPPPSEPPESATVKPVPPPTLSRCEAPLATAIVIEAQPENRDGGGMGGMHGMGGMNMDPYARLGIAPLGRVARTLADKSGCFRTLESDPALLAMPGGVQPEIVLRVRAPSIVLVERSLMEKAESAAKRYAGRYTGSGEMAPEALKSAEVSLEFICPKQKRVVQAFKGAADGPLGEPTLSGERLDTVPGANQERVAVAYAGAQDAAVSALRAKPKPCE